MTREELEHKIARIASTFSEPNGGYKRTNGERNEEASYLKRDGNFKQIMQLIDSYTQAKVLEARISELDWGLSRLNTFGKETDSQALNRAINEFDDNIATLQAEKEKL